MNEHNVRRGTSIRRGTSTDLVMQGEAALVMQGEAALQAGSFVGKAVIITGLVGRPELNGVQGNVVLYKHANCPQADSTESLNVQGRYAVQV